MIIVPYHQKTINDIITLLKEIFESSFAHTLFFFLLFLYNLVGLVKERPPAKKNVENNGSFKQIIKLESRPPFSLFSFLKRVNHGFLTNYYSIVINNHNFDPIFFF